MRSFFVLAILLPCITSLVSSPQLLAANEPETGKKGAESEPENLARQIDTSLAAELKFTKDELAQPTSDEQFLRRVTLDIVGENPSPEEVVAFLLNDSPDKRAEVVEQLLASPRYGTNWGRYWRDVIMARRSEQRALLASRPAAEYLSEVLNENQPWDEIARSFITAKGDVRELGETAIIMAQVGEPEETVAEVSRIFLGIQIQCAQCHNHPTDRWTREQFHQLAAFFPRVAVRPNRADEQRTIMVDTTDDQQGIRPLQNGERTLGTAEHFMSDLNNPTARGKMMKPVFFVTGDSVEIGTNDKERRQALADWLTSDENEWFARAMVNRMWAELVGEGFYPLVDDIGPDRVAIAPKTLDLLSKEFVAHDYDVKWLVKTITATDAYQRQSRPRRSVGEKPFAANVPQPLRADQLYNVLTRFLEVEQEAIPLVPYGNRGGLRAMVESDFTYDPSLPREEVVGTIPQALVLMNSPLLGELLSTRATSLPAKVAADFEDDGQLVYETYLKALGREPTDKELAATAKHVAKTADRVQAVADLYWVLINSTEFRYRN